jgi:subtilisin family serine protease
MMQGELPGGYGMRKAAKNQFDWKGSIETLEDRRVMSADPLLNSIEHHYYEEDDVPQIEHQLVSEPDFWLDVDNLTGIEDQLNQIEQTLYSAHNTTGLNSVVSNYGFTGIGQTVAVIDSGIAYDHFALGGGFGANYRVVGGWDFTGENDANPYDDGPEGSHGTHVAGIVGGSEGNDKGVAPGVDLVALRVFDDAGNGYFSWVENALRWVIQNQNSFENPITAINLSLGVSSWNSNTIPSWSTLEDEFAQLETAGIFIAVSAGNSYASYNSPGLGYPAASPYVVPVMSVTDAGVLAGYSQRDTRAIAAPGSGIRSTVPDYKGNNNGIADDYASFSGTSMASPYIAGASVLIRQAMEFVGRTNITQDMIYDHMMATGTSFVDSATGLTFKRLNLGAAISDLMPTDDYGSTTGTAFNLGSLSGTQTRSGVISTLTDVDYFRFTASSTGRVTFTASDMTHEMDAAWTLANGTGTVSGTDGEAFSFDVVAGQTYTVGLSSTGGLGYYDLEVASLNTFTYTDWGTVSYSQLNGLSASGETWYRVAASQTGYITVESMFGTQSGQLNLQLYNANRSQVLSTGNAANGSSRVDTYATAGQEFYVCVVGTNSDVDYRLSNLVSVSGTTVNVTGTSGNDTITFAAGSNHTLTVNGVTHNFAATAVNAFNINGGGGTDGITYTGTAGVETATLRVGQLNVVAAGLTTEAVSVENIVVNSGSSAGAANLYDSVGDDTFVAQPEYGLLTGNGYSLRVNNFSKVFANSNAGGYDQAFLYDSAGNDTYASRPEYAMLSGSGYANRANGFDQSFVYANNGGQDRGYFYDSAGNDTFTARPDYAVMSGNGYYNYANDLELVYAYPTLGGFDVANFYDSNGDDIFVARPEYARLNGTGFYNYGKGFDAVNAYALNGGQDFSYLYDSTGNDTFIGRPEYGRLYGTGFDNKATGFDRVYAYATSGGIDRSYLYDSAGIDQFVGTPDYGRMSGAGYYNYSKGFDMVYAYSRGNANDQAILRGPQGNDLAITQAYWRLYGTGYYNYANGFDKYEAYDENGQLVSSSVDTYFDELGA